jgi:hypothetical protein
MEPSFYSSNMPINDFIEACKKRLAELDAQMRGMQEERQNLLMFLGGYGQLQQKAKAQFVHVPSIPPAPAPDFAPGGLSEEERREKWKYALEMFGRTSDAKAAAENSINDRILAHVAILLADGRKKTSELVVRLNAVGLRLNSSNQQALLSTLMSKDDRFVASRKFGWGLKGRDDADDEPEEEE